MNLREIQREFNLNLQSIAGSISNSSEKGLAYALNKIRFPLLSPFLWLEKLTAEKIEISFGAKPRLVPPSINIAGALSASSFEAFQLLTAQHGNGFFVKPLSSQTQFLGELKAPLKLRGELPFLPFESFLKSLDDSPRNFEWFAVVENEKDECIMEINLVFEIEQKNKTKKLGL